MNKCENCFVYQISEIDKFQPELRWCQIKKTWVKNSWNKCLDAIRKQKNNEAL